MGMKSQLKNFVMTKFLAADSRTGSSTGASHVWRQVIRRVKQGDQKSEEWTMQDRPEAVKLCAQFICSVCPPMLFISTGEALGEARTSHQCACRPGFESLMDCLLRRAWQDAWCCNPRGDLAHACNRTRRASKAVPPNQPGSSDRAEEAVLGFDDFIGKSCCPRTSRHRATLYGSLGR